MTTQDIVLLGHGEMGHAFEKLLQSAPVPAIWTRRAEATGGPRLEQMTAAAGYVIFCLPVVAHEAVAKRLATSLPANAVCISIAKGLDEAGRPAWQLLREYLPRHEHAVLYGPMIAEEILAGRVAFAQVGAVAEKTAEAVMNLFQGGPLYLQAATDMAGLSWAVILKNVYAILFGVADELALGDNMRGYLMTRSLYELSVIVQQMGGEAHTAFGLAGLGDLTTTATSEASHHHGLGRCLARDDCAAIEGEGVHTLDMVVRHRLFRTADFPLFELCRQILARPRHCRRLVEEHLAELEGAVQ